MILETKTFNEAGQEGQSESLPPTEDHHLFVPVRPDEGAYITANAWDLVVVDEAHRLRNVYKPSNKIANAIKNAIADPPQAAPTATPLQNSLLELYGLVSIIDEFTFGDLKSFRSQFTRLNTPRRLPST